MIEKMVRFEAVCDVCGENTVFDSNRVAMVISKLRGIGWRVNGMNLVCPDCIEREKQRMAEEAHKTEEAHRVEEIKSDERNCPKCGCHLAEIWDSGTKIGTYCAECKEERLG